MKLIDRMAAEDISHSVSECLQRLGEIDNQLTLGEKLIVSLWWGRRLPNLLRPVAAVIVHKKVR
jgi:hypothetical protein